MLNTKDIWSTFGVCISDFKFSAEDQSLLRSYDVFKLSFNMAYLFSNNVQLLESKDKALLICKPVWQLVGSSNWPHVWINLSEVIYTPPVFTIGARRPV